MQKNKKLLREFNFSKQLLHWNKTKNFRKMPWKGEKNPYRIWLSEIILQQTRVEQGLAYYERFIQTFPDIQTLANAPAEKVFKLWEGLGYYSRCRNLIAAANYISKEGKGKFPDTYHEILALKGVGPYTAAAISSFAFNLPYAVVDGNVFRVLARIFGIYLPIDSSEGKKYFTQLANELLDKKKAGIYNQAIMDFGAVICKPLSPLCGECVFNKVCHAFLHKEITDLPVKEKKIKIKTRWFYYLIVQKASKIMIRQRTEKDIWQGLYEFPMVETEREEEVPAILKLAEKAGIIEKNGYTLQAASSVMSQQLSHQVIKCFFITVKLKNQASIKNKGWVTKDKLDEYAFPLSVKKYMQKEKEALFSK